MKVLKFWWTSVWSSEMIKNVAKIVVDSNKSDDIVVVVSAMTWVTNILIELCEHIAMWDCEFCSEIISKLRKKHVDTFREIWDFDENNRYYLSLVHEINNLEEIIKWIVLLKSLNDSIEAKILYFWEIFSSILVSYAVNNLWIKSSNYKTKNILLCHWNYLNWECNFEKSEKLVIDWMKNIDLKLEIPILTWFWWWDEEWNIYLFDRWWSDYVWALMWRFLNATCIEIWTDVDWIMSADPRIVETPVLWDELDYAVCAEFALVWAKVLHPKTISPAQEKYIPVWIKNTFNPNAKWTKICKKLDKWLKWINVDDKQVMLNFTDPTMIWWYGYVYHVTKILYEEKISIDAIATTETSFSITIKSKYYTDELFKKFAKLKEQFQINIYTNLIKVSFVWDSIDDHKILSHFSDEIIMLTWWAYWKSFTVFVKANNPKKLLIDLHKKVFWK